jgi:hypothetical protein
MRERPHGLAAHPFTGAKSVGANRLAIYRSGGGSGAPPVEMGPVDLGGAAGFLRWAMVGGRGGTGVATGATVIDAAAFCIASTLADNVATRSASLSRSACWASKCAVIDCKASVVGRAKASKSVRLTGCSPLAPTVEPVADGKPNTAVRI